MSSEIVAYLPDIGFDQAVPFALLTLAGLIVLGLDAVLDKIVKGITPERRDAVLRLVTGGALAVTGATIFGGLLGDTARPFFEGALRTDDFGNLGALIIILSSLAFLILSPDTIRRLRLPAGELYALLLFSVLSMVMLCVANELLTAFVCIEISSLALYCMAGVDRRNRKGTEAAFKYFILGAFASAFLVLGIAFVFGSTGTTQLFGERSAIGRMHPGQPTALSAQLPTDVKAYDLGINEVLLSGERLVNAGVPVTIQESDAEGNKAPVTEIRTAVIKESINPLWVLLGFALLFVGLCFKLSLAPFHMWAPDVYEGAPTIVTMFIATASKVSAFAFLTHIITAMSYWSHFPSSAGTILAAVAAVSMLWGNLGALIQTNIKRMLAYSSIAHGGYIAVGIATLVSQSVFSDATQVEETRLALLFYLFSYTVMNVVAFSVVATLGKEGEGDIKAYRGLAKRRPGLALAMMFAMITLMGLGIPGTIGFWGKFYVFKEAMESGLIGLAVIGMIASAISAFYYLRVVVAMYMQKPDEGQAVAGADAESTLGQRFVVGLATSFIFLFGLFPPLFFALGGH